MELLLCPHACSDCGIKFWLFLCGDMCVCHLGKIGNIFRKYRTYNTHKNTLNIGNTLKIGHRQVGSLFLLMSSFGHYSFSSAALYTLTSLSTSFSCEEPWTNLARHSKAASYSWPPPIPFFSLFRFVPARVNHLMAAYGLLTVILGLHVEIVWSFLVGWTMRISPLQSSVEAASQLACCCLPQFLLQYLGV